LLFLLPSPSTTLQNIKLLQKLRGKGATAISLGEADLLKAVEMERDAAAAAPASAVPVSGAVEFGAEGKDVQAALIDEQMEKYIQEQLASRRALRAPTSSKTSEDAPLGGKRPNSFANLSEDQLFVTPEHLKIVDNRTQEEIEETGERWLTGLAEVPLSIKDKMANIEKTEAARAKHLAQIAA
jgi:hypothetical protein